MSLYTVPELIERLSDMDFEDAQLADGQVVYEAAQALKQLRGNLSLAKEGLASAMQEIHRLQQDIQELTCGDPRLVCPNCRPAQIRQLCPECMGYMPCALHPRADGEQP